VEHPYWTDLLRDVLPGRVEKPRISGLTMVIDGGLPIAQMRGLFELAASHIDYWKLGYGSAMVCPGHRIQDKISLCQEYDILAYPGGTTFEIAFSQGVWKEYLEALWYNGIRAVEVSDGSIHVSPAKRREVIQRARQMGFKVLAEVGKKDATMPISLQEQVRVMKSDLSNGADYVIVEARESGRGIGIYDADGQIRESDVAFMVAGLGSLSTRVFWEAPLLSQQISHIRRFGHKVNLGNVHPGDIIAVESLRRGLRWDTMAVSGAAGHQATQGASMGGDILSEEGTLSREDKDSDGPGPTLWVDSKPRKHK